MIKTKTQAPKPSKGEIALWKSRVRDLELKIERQQLQIERKDKEFRELREVATGDPAPKKTVAELLFELSIQRARAERAEAAASERRGQILQLEREAKRYDKLTGELEKTRANNDQLCKTIEALSRDLRDQRLVNDAILAKKE